jgi:soluble lytic murein transglycosylase-like protein
MATKEQVYEFARQEAQRQGVPYSLVQKIVETESGGSFNAIGPKTRFNDRAYGPMQLMSATAKDLGVNRMDWKDNIRGGVKYLGQLTERFQDPTLVAAAYNAGPGNVEKYGGVPPFKETQNYVQKVVGTNMATFRDIDPSLLAQPPQQRQPNANIGTSDVGNIVVPQAGFREIDPSMIGQPVVQQAPAPQSTAFNRLGNQAVNEVGRTIRYGLEGAGGIADIVGSPLNMLINRATGSQLQNPSQAMSNFANLLGLPQPETNFQKGIANVTRAVAGIPVMGGVGGLLQQAPNLTAQVVGRGLAAQPIAQAAGATVGTGSAEIARNVFDIQNPLALLGINLATGLPAGAVAARAGNIPSGTRYRDPVTGQIIESAAQRGVNVDVGDVGGPGAGTLTKSRQFGYTTEASNQAKANQVKSLIERTTDNLRPAGMKEGGEKKIIADDLRQQYKIAKNNVNPEFKQAEILAGDDIIPLRNTNQAKLNVVKQFPSTSQTPIIEKTLNKLDELSQSGGGSYKELRDLQSTVFAELERVRKGVVPGSYNEKQVNAINQLYKGMADDVDVWAAPAIDENGARLFTPAGAQHTKAMDQFKQTVLPFREDTNIYKLVSSRSGVDDIDLAAQKFNFDTNPATAERAVSLMSPVGKQAAQYSILNEARNKAINPDAATGFSAPAFTRTLNLGRPDAPTPQRTAFASNPELLDEVTMLRDIVDTTRGAITPKVAPQTGAALLPFVTGGIGATAGNQAAQMLGFDSALGTGFGGLLGASLAPASASRLSNVLGSQAGTRFLLGEQLQGAGGMGGAIGQGVNAATNDPENFFPNATGLFDMFR